MKKIIRPATKRDARLISQEEAKITAYMIMNESELVDLAIQLSAIAETKAHESGWQSLIAEAAKRTIARLHRGDFNKLPKSTQADLLILLGSNVAGCSLMAADEITANQVSETNAQATKH